MRQGSSQLKRVLFSSRVRSAAAEICAAAQYVKIREDLMPVYTAGLLQKYPLITRFPEFEFLKGAADEKKAAYVLALDSINFGSGYFHVARKSGVALEYVVISEGLKKAFLSGRLDTPQKWAATTAEECHDVFAIPNGAHLALNKLMSLFAKHLRASGETVLSAYNGHVMNLVAAADGSAVRLAEIVAAWPSFADVPLYKRAQIFVADVNLAFGNDYFSDMGELTCFADNMVPHVLRHDGILEYAPELAEKIDAGVMVEEGSREEMELRASAVHAVELMKQSADGKATSVNIDHILWNRGYEQDIYAKPSHRTMTVWY